MEPATRWRELMSLPEDELPLDEAALAIAAHANPAVDVAAQLGRLDDLAAWAGPGDIDRVCTLLFETLGLRGDRDSYDDPRNSYLDQVLDRRLGIPISLSVLLIAVGRRCGIDLEGVGMPAHFLVRDSARPDHLIDAFGGGRRLDRAGCQDLLRSLLGPGALLEEHMLARTGSWATLARMLANLDASFVRRSDRGSLVWVTRLRAHIPSTTLGERAEMAKRLAEFGCHDEALALLTELAADPQLSADSSRRLRTQALALRAQLN